MTSDVTKADFTSTLKGIRAKVASLQYLVNTAEGGLENIALFAVEKNVRDLAEWQEELVAIVDTLRTERDSGLHQSSTYTEAARRRVEWEESR